MNRAWRLAWSLGRARLCRVMSGLVGLLLLLVLPQSLRAHPIHTTYAEVSTAQGTTTIQLRAFADDFATAVARFNNRAVPRDSAAPPADVARYVSAMLRVTDTHGQPVTLAPCGVRRAGALTYVCVTLPARAGLQLVNRVLTDLHADQVNIMQLRGGRTLLFTPTGAAQALAASH